MPGLHTGTSIQKASTSSKRGDKDERRPRDHYGAQNSGITALTANAMTSDEKELLEQYLTHLNVLGNKGTHPDFDAWYQEVRYAQAQTHPSPWRRHQSRATGRSWTPPGFSNRLVATKSDQPISSVLVGPVTRAPSAITALQTAPLPHQPQVPLERVVG